MEIASDKWRRSRIHDSMENYRKGMADYYIKGKKLVELENGTRAFSLLSPALGSPAARQRVRSIMRNVVDKKTEVDADGGVAWGSRTPHIITIAVTYNCQCRCTHCSASAYKEDVKRKKNPLEVSEIKNAIRQSIDLGTTCVILTGGEPLLFSGLDELVEEVDRSRSICTIFSNGEYLSARHVDALKSAGAFGVFVSLDDSDPEKHDKNRHRKGLFDKAVRGIDLCQRRGILTGLSTYVTKEKIRSGELDRFMELAKDLDVLEVFLFDVIAAGELYDHRDDMLSDEETFTIGKLRATYNARPDYPQIVHQTMFTNIAYPCAAEGCPAGVVQMHLRGNGDVTPCDFTPLSFGNIREQSLRDIWGNMIQSDTYSSLSRRCRLASGELWNIIEKSDSIV